jgi:ribosomal protein L23
MIRSGKRRDPNEAVFRVPSFLNKLDIKQYLEKIYQLPVLRVHTVNFLARESQGGRKRRSAYKNAIVTYSGDSFHYPPQPPPEELKFPLQDAAPKYPKIG